jgi:sulfide:quinone oxidoreductase
MRHPAQVPTAVEPRDVLIIGGGIGGIEALMGLADLGEHALRLHLVAAHASFVLRPQVVGRPWGGDPLHIDLERLCRAFGARFTNATVTDVDAGAHRVSTAGGDTLGYDRLLLAPGAHLSMPYTATRVIGFGPLPSTLVAGHGGSVAVVVPDGTSWTLPAYELALLAAGPDGDRDVRVITPEAAPLEAFGPGTEDAVRSFLDRRGVAVQLSRLVDPDAPTAELADIVVALPLVGAPTINGVPRDRAGFFPVDERMAVRGCEHVYAAGDAIDRPIKQGGLASQQADIAATELVRSCGGSPPVLEDRPILRGALTVPGDRDLYLRRALDGRDDGTTHDRPLWQPPGVVCAWRLSRWLAARQGDAAGSLLDHVAHATAGGV